MVNKTLNFLMYGKLGDFTHSLFAVRQVCLSQNVKANLHMVDIGWDFGIENTYKELLPILLKQNYINSFNILKNYELDPIQTPNQNTPIKIFDKKLLNEGYIDLGNYIRSPLLYKKCWAEIYSNLCNFEIDINNYKSIEFNEIDEKFKEKIVLHRRTTSLNRLNSAFPYEEIINNHKHDIIFISTSQNDYDIFPYKKGIEFYKINTITDWYKTINSCKLLITNLSAPEAIGNALDVFRLIELPYTIDSNHFFNEPKYSNKMFYYLNNEINNCQSLFEYT